MMIGLNRHRVKHCVQAYLSEHTQEEGTQQHRTLRETAFCAAALRYTLDHSDQSLKAGRQRQAWSVGRSHKDSTSERTIFTISSRSSKRRVVKGPQVDTS